MTESPKFNKESPESFEQRDNGVLDRLRKAVIEGMPESERIDVIKRWREEEEKLVPDTHEASVMFNVRLAVMKEAAGFRDDALDDLYEAKYQAEQEENAALIGQIDEIIQKFS